MTTHKRARIIGLGSYLPERILSNFDLEKIVDTSDEWISSRTGMKERRIAATDEFASDMGRKAALKALQKSGTSLEDIDIILVATTTPDYMMPTTANLIQAQLGAKNAAAVDFHAACTGFLYGLSLAKAYIESGMYRNVLLIATEKMSAFVDYTDRNTCILFGDGAAAALISGRGEGLLIGDVCLGSDGDQGHLITLLGGGARHPCSAESLKGGLHHFRMSGKEVFKHAVRRMTSAAEACISKAQLPPDQIEWLIPHQANERIIDAVGKNFAIPAEKIYKTVHKYGNTSAPSAAIALDELMQEHPIHENQNLLMVAFGAGLTWGASILTKCLY
ncbi:beta-ketoacyl-ACP synthase III [Parachlamydia sp. AcF125]|uniref:beta-ketoacyl-ACP synthase III n=1 Tax=Parachlamydia sp. AcF125 TaxID=2795736 RepID=UPI001BC96987|nr:beta-ketoacyl-ACP synthase III [Parachlamydia sp. AcF125]MBS4169189.1 3-oxoacyl-[acyl-carrier-protein] synthase 3 protein 1 [Parachlamydia sp. AcF125]